MNWTTEEYRDHLRKQHQTKNALSRNRQPVPRSKAEPTRKPQPAAFDAFLALLEASGLPLPETEAEFIEGRKFRADYLWRARKVIVEQNGQIWKKGGHSSGTGLLRDYEKANLANAAGWCYLTFTPQQLASGECLPLLRILLGEEK